MRKFYLFIISIFLFSSCTQDDLLILNAETVVQEGHLMFQDRESKEVLTSHQRAFYVDKLIDAQLYYPKAHNSRDSLSVGEGKIRVYNGVPHDFHQIKVLCQMRGMDVPFILADLEVLPAQYELMIDNPLFLGKSHFKTVNGGDVSIDHADLMADSLYTLSLSCEDSVFEKLRMIKQTTYCKFNQYNTNNANWGETTPEAVRHYMTAVANTAFVYSSEKFRNNLIQYEKVLHDNQIEKNADGKIIQYNPINREEYLEKLLNQAKWNLGVCSPRVGGLGGGSTFGINGNYLINGHYERVDGNQFPLEAWAHEFSHCRGYSHASNMTYGNSLGSYVSVFIQTYKEMIELGELPFSGPPVYPQEGNTNARIFNEIEVEEFRCAEHQH